MEQSAILQQGHSLADGCARGPDWRKEVSYSADRMTETEYSSTDARIEYGGGLFVPRVHDQCRDAC